MFSANLNRTLNYKLRVDRDLSFYPFPNESEITMLKISQTNLNIFPFSLRSIHT